MKSKALFLSCKIAVLLMIFFTACKKGDTGPKGDAGPQGEKGTVNVIYSAWMATNPWIASTTSTGTGKATFYFDITSTQVTQGIIDSGTVLVYAKFVADLDGTSIAKLLPSIYYNAGSANTQYRFQHGLLLNKIRIICDVLPTGSPSSSNQVRYIIIPGGTPASGRVMKPDFTTMSYDEVCRLYGIPE